MVWRKIQLHTSVVMNPDAFIPVFTSAGIKALTSMDLLFKVQWSAKGFNRQREEERVFAYYSDFVEELEGKNKVIVLGLQILS